MWTNDDLSNLKGGVSVVGNGASASRNRLNLPYGEHTDDISIISPVDGTVVQPGETISVEVEVAPAVKLLSGVAIMSPMDTGMQLKASPPYTFSIQIPGTDGPSNNGPLIGQQLIAAIGVAPDHKILESAPVTVDVEKPDLPVSLSPQMPTLFFKSANKALPLIMLAKFPDGSILEVNESTNFSFASSDTTVATVDAHGVVVATGAGSASIITTYTHIGKKIEASIPVVVRIPPTQAHVSH